MNSWNVPLFGIYYQHGCLRDPLFACLQFWCIMAYCISCFLWKLSFWSVLWAIDWAWCPFNVLNPIEPKTRDTFLNFYFNTKGTISQKQTSRLNTSHYNTHPYCITKTWIHNNCHICILSVITNGSSYKAIRLTLIVRYIDIN